MPSIPFVSSALDHMGHAGYALGKKNYANAALHATGAISDVAFPAFIGKTMSDSFKEGKMTAAEQAKLRRSGFAKEAGLISGTVGLVGKTVGGVGGAIARHPLIATGVGVGGAGVYGANRFGKAVKETRQQVGPTGQYGGQFQ